MDVRDVGRDPAASQEVSTRLGCLGVPTIVIEERVFVGVNAHRAEFEVLARD